MIEKVKIGGRLITLKKRLRLSSNTSSPSGPLATSLEIFMIGAVLAHVRLVDEGSLKKLEVNFSFSGLSNSVR